MGVDGDSCGPIQVEICKNCERRDCDSSGTIGDWCKCIDDYLKSEQRDELSELRKLIEEEAALLRDLDKEMLAKGHTHRVTWWNHRTGGEDIQADMYFSADPLTLTPEDGTAYEEWRSILYESTTNNQKDYQIIKLEGV